MKRPNLPPIQGKRFDVEALQYNVVGLMKQADKGPTFLRHSGRITHVVITEELFDTLWPDPRRAYCIHEMPLRLEKLLFAALDKSLSENEETTARRVR